MNEHNSPQQNWSEFRTAYHVARLGTLSAAAAYLGVHHATVIRHIDQLEERLSSKLFHRHPRGYVPTEAGQDLMRIAGATEDQFAQLANRLRGKGEGVSGELVVTTLSGLSPIFTPIMADFQLENPEVRFKMIADERRLKLEYGEAHVALRAGPKPQEPDNVVQYLGKFPMALFAHKKYVERHGLIKNQSDLKNHRFVVSNPANIRAPFGPWIKQNVTADMIAFQAAEMRGLSDAIAAGAGIGFLMALSAVANEDLVQMMPSDPEWDTVVWMVTHVDLHRTAKIQAFLAFLKGRFPPA